MSYREAVGGWLAPDAGGSAAGQKYPGESKGLPETGPGSITGWGRRLAALVIDWLACLAVAHMLGRLFFRSPEWQAWGPLAVFALMNLLLVGTAGYTLGQRLLGLQVRRLVPTTQGASLLLPGPGPAAIRTLLLCLVVPALIWNGDNQGLHDRAAGTVVIHA